MPLMITATLLCARAMANPPEPPPGYEQIRVNGVYYNVPKGTRVIHTDTGITIIEPFHFSTARRLEALEANATANMTVQTDTP